MMEPATAYRNDHFAARRDTVQAPNLLVGHSLGGAAVIMAASRIEEVVAVATIDRADHLLSNPRDADYVATVTASWVDRYLPEQARSSLDAQSYGDTTDMTDAQRNRLTSVADRCPVHKTLTASMVIIDG